MNLRDIVVRNALLHPDKTALVFNGRRLSHAQFAARGFQLANALLSLGLRRQERVAVLAPNCPEYLEVFCACESAGLVIVNLYHRLAAPELVQIGQDCEPAVLAAQHRAMLEPRLHQSLLSQSASEREEVT